ncbi:ABC transporter permease [Enterococcus faecalis]|uniref:ABC transporter permease n=1 Tax=Enterococcus faecalis TaxID=1351 RepID=UPI0001F0C2F3|nr:ABC transporter permease [Enterococcus faecalis]EFT40724.1 bacitracin transport permease protein [Enterococcus faecalis TX4000]MCE7020018.1 ABC transporter permease [Enterococcus faecalis]WAG37793.1 ABC transporter permease [Enterococcus faecalis]
MWGLLDLVICEFAKLKRLKFVQLSILAAFLFPIPITFFMYADGMTFDHLFRANFMYGSLLLLPCVLGIVASMLFFMEQDNETLKNLVTIPVSRESIVLAKLAVIIILSIVYSVANLFVSILGGLIVSGVEDILYRLLISILLGILIGIATLPIILVIVYFNKSFIFSIIVSFLYASTGFAITLFFSASPESINAVASILPISIVFKWYLTLFPVEEALSYVLPYTSSTLETFIIMVIYAVVFVSLSAIVYKKNEI